VEGVKREKIISHDCEGKRAPPLLYCHKGGCPFEHKLKIRKGGGRNQFASPDATGDKSADARTRAKYTSHVRKYKGDGGRKRDQFVTSTIRKLNRTPLALQKGGYYLMIYSSKN